MASKTSPIMGLIGATLILIIGVMAVLYGISRFVNATYYIPNSDIVLAILFYIIIILWPTLGIIGASLGFRGIPKGGALLLTGGIGGLIGFLIYGGMFFPYYISIYVSPLFIIGSIPMIIGGILMVRRSKLMESEKTV